MTLVTIDAPLEITNPDGSLRRATVEDFRGPSGPPGASGGSAAPPVIAAGNLGAAYTVDFLSAAKELWVTGTLNANCTITIANRVAGCRVSLLLVQDGTGGRTLTISDGTTTQLIDGSTAPGATRGVLVRCPNATDLYVDPLGTAGTNGVNTFNGRSGPVTLLTGDLPSGVASGAALGTTSLQSSQLGTASGAAEVGSDGYVGGTAGTALSPLVDTGSFSHAGDVTGVRTALQVAVTTNARSVHRQIGRGVINLTDPKYGGVADSGTTDNTAAILLAITDAQALKLPIYAPGNAYAYGFSGNVGSPSTGGTITFPDGVDLIGDGTSTSTPATRFLCKSAASTLAFGNTGPGTGINFGENPLPSGSVGSRGGVSGNFIVDGNNVATNPLFIGRRTQQVWDPLFILNAATQPAYNGATAYTTGQRVFYKGFTFQALTSTTGTAPTVTAWTAAAGGFPVTNATWQVIADSAGLIVQESQNCNFLMLEAQNCAGSGLIWDGGTGGHNVHVLELNGNGVSGAWQMMFMQTYTTATLYQQPQAISFHGGLVERPGSAISLGNILCWAGLDITFHDPFVCQMSGVTGPYAAVSMVSDGVRQSARLRFDKCRFQLDSSNSTIFAVSSGCQLRHAGTVVNSTQYCYLIQSGGTIEEDSPDFSWTSKTSLNPAGTGVLGTAVGKHFSAPIGAWSGAWKITETGVATGLVLPAGGSLPAADAPTGAITVTTDRSGTLSNQVMTATGVLLVVRAKYALQAGQVVTNIKFAAAATALVTGTRQYAYLLDDSLNILAHSNDLTSTAWNSDQTQTFTLTTPYTAPAIMPVRFGLYVAAATMPTLLGAATRGGAVGQAPILCLASSSVPTNPADATTMPSPVVAGATLAMIPFAFAT